MRGGAKRRIESVRSADRDGIDRSRPIPRAADVSGPFLAGGGRPSLVEQDQRAALRRRRQDRGAFLGPPFVWPPRPRFADLANIDAGEAGAPRALLQPLEVTIEQQTLRPRLQLADANQRETHRLSSCRPLPADPRSTSFRGYRTGGHPDGRCGRWRSAHRAGPSRKAASPRLSATENRPRDRP